MTEALAPEIKRLRKLTPAALADEVGQLKARIAALDEQLEGYKAEGIRRGLEEIDGTLFRLTFSPPGSRFVTDSVLLRSVMGDAFANHFTRAIETGWVMRCVARTAA